MDILFRTPVKLSSEEIILASAATLVLRELEEKGATTKDLGSTCTNPQYGHTASANIEPLGPRFLRITDLQEAGIAWREVPYCTCDNPEKYYLEAGDILVARTGSVGKTYYIEADPPEPAVFASYLIRLRPKEGLCPNFLYWCLQSRQFWTQILKQSRGSAIKNINSSMLKGLSFPIPELKAQQAISAYLEQLVGAVNERRSLPSPPSPVASVEEQVYTIAEAVHRVENIQDLHEDVEERITALLGAAQQRALEQYRDGSQKEWKNGVRLNELCTLKLGATPSRSNPVFWGGDNTWVTISDLNEGTVTDSAEHITDAGVENSSVKRVNPGTLLMSFKLTIGKMALAGVPLYTNEAIVALPIKEPDRLDVRYLRHALKATDLLEDSKGAMKGRTLNKTSLGDLVVPVPPIEEQRHIAQRLDMLESRVGRIRERQSYALQDREALLPALVRKRLAP